MDAITLAGSFATIVGLLVSFQSIKDKANISDFLEWLRENNNANTANIIENDIELQQQLSIFISQNHDEVMAQLSTLNNLMVSIASRMDGLSGLASKFENNNGLSDQAISVLRQFVNSESQSILVQRFRGDIKLYLLDKGGQLDFEDHRLIEDDFRLLSEYQLVISRITDKGTQKYEITRKALELINSIDNNE